jgi:hypothetical protein
MKKTAKSLINVIYQDRLYVLQKVQESLFLPDDVMEDLKNLILDANEDLSSKKTPITSEDRCMALIGNGNQCTRKHLLAQNKGESTYCAIHSNKRIGTVSTSTSKSSNINNTKASKRDVDETITSALFEQSFDRDEYTNSDDEQAELSVDKVIHDGRVYLVSKQHGLVFDNKPDNPNIIGKWKNGVIILNI